MNTRRTQDKDAVRYYEYRAKGYFERIRRPRVPRPRPPSLVVPLAACPRITGCPLKIEIC